MLTIENFVIFILSLVLTLILTPLSIKLAPIVGAIDKPNARKINIKLMPRMGGVAIASAFFLIISGLYIYNPNLFSPLHITLIIGAIATFALGLTDDIKELSSKIKFIFQFLIAGFLISQGVAFETLSSPFTGEILVSGWPMLVISFFWIVGVSNAINLIDGLDGLAAGTTLIVLTTLSGVAVLSSNYETLIITLPLIGAILGFLKYNFNPAKTFMGDGGSLFLGYWVATISITSNSNSSTTAGILVPLITLSFPIFDTVFSMARRVLIRKRPFAPDKEHVHHQILAMGFSHKQTVLILYTATLCLSLIAISILLVNQRYVIGLLILVSLGAYRTIKHLGYFKRIVSFRHEVIGRGKRIRYLDDDHFNVTQWIHKIVGERWVLPILDSTVFIISWMIALYIANVNIINGFEDFFPILGLHLVFISLSFNYWLTYKFIWRYTKATHLARFLKATLIPTFLTWIFSPLLYQSGTLDFRFFFELSITFSSLIILVRLSQNYYFNLIKREIASVKSGPRIIIYGAGDSGEIAHEFLVKNDELEYQVIGFIDDDPRKKDLFIADHQVFGGLKNFNNIIVKHPFDILVLSSKTVNEQKYRDLKTLSTQYKFRVVQLKTHLMDVL